MRDLYHTGITVSVDLSSNNLEIMVHLPSGKVDDRFVYSLRSFLRQTASDQFKYGLSLVLFFLDLGVPG